MSILVVLLRWVLDVALRRPKIPKECRGGWRRTYVDLPEPEPDAAVPTARVHAIRGALGWPTPSSSWPLAVDADSHTDCAPTCVWRLERSRPVAMPIPGDGAPRS